MTKEHMIKIEIQLNEDNMARLKAAAEKNGVSYSEIITDALDFYDLEQNEELADLLQQFNESVDRSSSIYCKSSKLEQLKIELLSRTKKHQKAEVQSIV